MRRLATVLFGLSLCGRAGLSEAMTVRVAVVVGNDAGAPARSPLHYAETDAAKVARVLIELGGVASDDLFLLQGRSVSVLQEAFQRATERIAAIHRTPGDRTVFLFYFSGHSDGLALELGADTFGYHELRHRLSETGADVRVAIIDSCRSGALLTTKGAQLGPAFEVRLSDDPTTSGQVLLTSSASDEEALESKEIHGSYFTHHFVSGLRGAADASGDNRVTLAEAYRYAYDHTVAATSDTVVGVQHPTYDFRLSGTSELVLTELGHPYGTLLLPADADRTVISEPWRDEVLAEVPRLAPRRLAVSPGDYLVRMWRSGTVSVGRVSVAKGQVRQISWNEMIAAPLGAGTQVKGGDSDAADLAHAIALFESFDNDEAKRELQILLQHGGSPPVMATAHLYLGIIAAGELNADVAKREFIDALKLNGLLELPVHTSPKVQLVFDDARRLLGREAIGGRANPSVPTEAVQPAPEFPAERRSHSLAWTLGGIALACAAASVVGGVEVASVNAQLSGAVANHVTAGSIPYGAAQIWQIVWPIAAGVSAAAGIGSVLAW